MVTHQLQTLPQLWRRWTDVVTLYASRAPRRLRVDQAEYEALQRALLQACQDVAASAGPERRVGLRSLEQLVRPWLCAGALEHAERELLADLLARCRSVEKDLSGWLVPIRRHRRMPWVFLGWLMVAPLLLAAAEWIWPSLRGLLQLVWRSARLSWRQAPEMGLWAVGAGLLVVVCVLVALASSARR